MTAAETPEIDVTAYDAAIAEAQAELDGLKKKIEAMEPLYRRKTHLESAIQILQSLQASRGGVVVTPEPARLSIASMVASILESGGKPLSLHELVEAMRRAGRVMPKTATESVRSILNKNAETFEKVGTGHYALRHWPAEKKRSI